MKKLAFAFFAIFMIMVFPTKAIKLDGTYYQGIGKIEGNPLDYWVTIEFDDEDAEVNLGNVSSFDGGYTLKGSGNNATITIKVPGGHSGTLNTSDGGESFEGTMKTHAGNVKLWILKVAGRHKKVEMGEAELKKVISSPDGYTSFVKLVHSGVTGCVTSDFEFTPEGRFGIRCDTPSLQEMFANIKGTYSVEGSEVKFTTDNGQTLRGTVYDNGNYITIPVGSKGGMDMTIILIR